MYKLPALLVLSSLALTGCLEQESSTDTQQNGVLQQNSTDNPFAPLTSEPQEVPNDPPFLPETTETAETTEIPETQPPFIPPTTGGLDTSALFNGVSEAQTDSLWVCIDSSVGFADELALFAFYSDGSGIAGDDVDLFPINWQSSGAYLEIFSEGTYLAQFDNVSINRPAGTLDMTYISAFGDTGTLACGLSEDEG